jgi:D-alanyl-lipoteichoic acid acyltransferase DltB (MBOAT superfamily)
MNSLLAWFITFNFINIAWIFFRAKEFGDALKVLKGMFFGEFMLPDKYAGKLTFLNDFGVEFGRVFGDIHGKDKTIYFIVGAFFITLMLKNSNELRQNFKPDYKNLIFTLILFFVATTMMSTVSEFLYFNF